MTHLPCCRRERRRAVQLAVDTGMAERRSVMDARSLRHLDQDVHEGRTGFHDVAGGAGDVGDNGALGAAPGVEQTGLAHVGAPHQGYPQPLLEQLALPRRVQGLLRPPPQRLPSEPHSWHACMCIGCPFDAHLYLCASRPPWGVCARARARVCRAKSAGSHLEGRTFSRFAMLGTRRKSIRLRVLEWDSYSAGRHLDGGGQGCNACGER